MTASAKLAIDRDRLLDRVERLSDRFLRLAESGAPSTPVDGTPGWSVGDVIAHMATVVPRYALADRFHNP